MQPRLLNFHMTKTKSKRIEYGFELNFPETFTLRDLRKAKSQKVKYITIYSRVKKALDSGELVIDGLREPAKARRGRKEIVYKRVSAVEDPVATADVAPPSVTNW